MKKIDCQSNLCVSCLIDNWYAQNFHVSLINHLGKTICSKKTNEKGKAYFYIETGGEYAISIASQPSFTPAKATRWVKICPSKQCNQVFIFKRISSPKLARLNIHLSDQFYPEYKLDQGEYELWLKY